MKSIILKLVFVVVTLNALVEFYENTQFCLKSREFMSDQEVLKVIVTETIAYKEAKRLSPNLNAEEYLHKHPNCCKIFKNKGVFSLFGLLPGKRRVVGRFKTSTNTIYSFSTHVDSCGAYLDRDRFYQISELASSKNNLKE